MNKIIILLFFIFSINLFSQEILELKDIKKGMKGIGYTVIEDTKIENFDIEILTIVKGEGKIHNMILAQIYGNILKKSGGIAEGMSGSPLYVDGKIIGALSYVLEEEGPTFALITPIEYILETNPGTVNIDLEKYKEIKPGMAISISPVRGDILFENIGTLTYYNDKGQFYAVGHQFNNVGDVGYFLNEASIDYTLNLKKSPYKLGRSIKTIGLVTQDRKTGVSGILTQKIKTYDFNIAIEENKIITNIKFEMVKNKKTLEMYLQKSIEESLLNVFDANEYHSIEYELEIFNSDDNLILSSGNFLFFENGLIETLSNEIGNEILGLISNHFQFLDFKKISMKLKPHKEKKLMFVKNMEVSKDMVRLGEKFILNLDYLVYQKGLRRKKYEIKIPEDFKIGQYKLKIVSGSDHSNDVKEEYDNLSSFIKYNKGKYRNNEMVVKIFNDDEDKFLLIKIPFDYYILTKTEFSKDIVIDSFEANNEENIKND